MAGLARVTERQRYSTDKQVIMQMAIDGIEQELDKATRACSQARDKLKKAHNLPVNDGRLLRLRNAHQNALLRKRDWERRLNIARNLLEVE